MDLDLQAFADTLIEAEAFEQARSLVERRVPIGVEQAELLGVLRNREVRLPPEGRVRRAHTIALLSARMAPAAVAPVLYTQGRLHWSDGRYEESIELLQVAATAYEWASDRLGEALVSVTLADALYCVSAYNEALRVSEAAAQILQAEGKLFELGHCYNTRANIWTNLQNPEQAACDYRNAIMTFEVGLDQAVLDTDLLRISLADALTNYGSLREEQFDEFDEAIECYNKARLLLGACSIPPESLWRSWFILNLNQAVVSLRLGQHTEARRLLDDAQNVIPDDAEGESDRFQVELYQGLQALLLGDTSEARRLLHRAQAQADQRDHEQELAEAALFAAMIPDEPFEQAWASLNEAQELAEKLRLSLAPAIIAIEQARRAYRERMVEKARSLLERAQTLLAPFESPRRWLELDVIRALYDPACGIEDLRHTAAQLEPFSDHPTRLALFTELGERLEQAGNKQAALTTYCDAIQAMEQARGSLRISAQSILFLARQRKPYERAFALSARQQPELALQCSEQAHAQVLLDELVNSGIYALTNRDATLAHELLALRRALDQARARTALVGVHATRAVAVAHDHRHHQRLEEAERAYAAMLDALQATSDEAAWIRSEIASRLAIQEILDEQTALISYLAVRRPASEERELWAVVLAKDGLPQAVRVASNAILGRLLRSWRQTPIDQPHLDRRVADDLLDLLYQAFLAGLAPTLAQYPHLVIVLDDQLPLFPLHAAHDPNGHYLLEQHTISYSPSGTVLRRCIVLENQRKPVGGTLLLGWEDLKPNQLPHVSEELERLASILGGEPQYGPLESLLPVTSVIGDARVVHIACHGVVPGDQDPRAIQPGRLRFAHLRLGPGVHLYAQDLYTQPLNADLLTLSACDTGRHGVGLQGLVSAGLVAGASAVLASMWAVNDHAAPELMERFYRALLQQGLGRAAALRKAQLDLLQQPELSHPAHWAPFFLTGVAGGLQMN